MAGVYHWPADGDKCFGYWAEGGHGCYNCIRVCPFNKPQSWLHDATQILIGAKSGAIYKLLLNLDDASGYGPEKGKSPDDFFDQENFMHLRG